MTEQEEKQLRQVLDVMADSTVKELSKKYDSLKDISLLRLLEQQQKSYNSFIK